MMIRFLLLIVGLLLTSPVTAAAPGAPGARFNVREFGAVGDGAQKDTAAISRAIAVCAAAGGGIVEFPAGKYLTGTVRLQSHVTLHVGPGATLLGSPDVADYPIVPNPWGPDDWQGPTQMSALIYADGAEHIGLTGGGTIDGQGLIWWQRLWFTEKKANSKRDVTGVNPADAEYVKQHGGRPRLIRLVNCRHVRIIDVTLQNSPRWTLHPLFCDFVTISGVTILNPANSSNTDGINPESCRNVHISNCHIDTGDDAITLKSGHNAVGRRTARPTENVTITNCTFEHAHGGIVIGSEMSGDVRNVTVSNCVFRGTEKGLRIKSNRDRGGVVERIRLSNLVMQDVVEPINIVTFYYSSDTPEQVVPQGEGTPRFRDIHVSDVIARGARRAGQITGLREMPIRDVSFRNVRISANTGFALQDAAGIRFTDVQIETKGGPAITGLRVSDLEIQDFRGVAGAKAPAVIDFQAAQTVAIRQARVPAGSGVFLRLRGAETRGIVLRDCELPGVGTRVLLAEAAPAGVVDDR